jgi:hypothetical protein
LTAERMKMQIKLVRDVRSKFANRDIQSMVQFLLVFNVFEARLFKERGEPVSLRLQKIVKDLLENPLFKYDFEPVFRCWVDRYIENGTTNQRFDNLKLSGRKDDVLSDRGRCKEALTKASNKQVVDDSEKLLCCFLVAYRFRNNLFHGNKNVFGLNLYTDCFQIITRFIASILDNMITMEFKGLTDKY